VVADTLDIARDAAERVPVDYAPRPAVVSARNAFEKDAPQLYDDCPDNEAYFYQAGDKAKVDAAFVSAAHVVEQRIVINRVTANPIEPRGVTGVYDVGTGRYTLHCGFQRPWLFRNGIAETTLMIPESQLRLITDDIGGSYEQSGHLTLHPRRHRHRSARACRQWAAHAPKAVAGTREALGAARPRPPMGHGRGPREGPPRQARQRGRSMRQSRRPDPVQPSAPKTSASALREWNTDPASLGLHIRQC
jgi:CO/xanthine dehydrogenase Mo-binding subunit